MAYGVGYYTVYFFSVLKSETSYIFTAQHKEAFQLVLSESTWSSFTTRVIDRQGGRRETLVVRLPR
jgi:hypothetical protein